MRLCAILLFACAACACGGGGGGGSSTSPQALPPVQQGPEEQDAGKTNDPQSDLENTTRLVLLANRPRLRVCYEDALAKTPDLEGRVVLVIDVGQNGRATHVLEGHREGLPDDVVRCLARVLKTIAFHDGAARTIRVQVPLAFSKRDGEFEK